MANGDERDEAHLEAPASEPTAQQDETPPPDNNHDEPPRDEARRGRLDNLIPDIVRRTFYAGLGAVFTTEEGIRKIASDLKLPKDMANYLIQQAAASKDELFRIVGRELRSYLEAVNISGELQKLLTSLSFEIKTEIRFIPNDEAIGGVKPDMKVGRMALRRNKDKEDKKGDKGEGE